MRLGRDVLEADLYGELGLLPDATESEIRLAYRQKVRASHPDLNQRDPGAAARMTRLNIAAKVLLDPSLRRSYDRAPRGARKPPSTPPARREWFERREQGPDNDWSAPPVAARERGPNSFCENLRGRDGRLGLWLQELVESLSIRQQLGVTALLVVIALGLVAMSRPQGLLGDSNQTTSVDLGVYP